ncbi:flavin-containing monooxygenase [Aspergillus ibericus CBS 121593]|uniref:Cyclohexanone monooxygenase n=1 Tax=Aspergillus ibericus CBS 121593 TaxID=1448316 RepID=A0A395GN97_9EURO|nr:cyclohexanone monooxygenase [Aspergillus ibericus CBS 121593]RAK96307.1 cyclohexanone monooxygenase [Aspergillus ibericus CBS 121593]
MPQEHHLDTLVVGTGFSGIYALYHLLKDGLNVEAIEKESEVGGAWWVNQYPGALSDTWSHVYRYSFDKDLLQTYPAARTYSSQPEILAYLKHVVEKHDLRRYMHFNTKMVAAKWDDEAKKWTVQCQTGDVYRVKYLITALGPLVKPSLPDIRGLDTFKGQIVHTSTWDPSIRVEGKRVGVIGVGSSGVQTVTAIASKVKSLHVFIRTPQYSVPANNRPMTPEERQSINERYSQIWSGVMSSAFGMDFHEPTRTLMSVSPQEREEILEKIWQAGNGIQLMFGAFSDVVSDEAANEEVCRFIRKKIAGIVKDPQKRAVLTPREPWNRRPLSDAGYYEQFNRENVYAIDIKKYPITEATPDGLRTADGRLHELDIIINATGFDALDGAYAGIDIRGRNKGEGLRDRWKRAGPDCYFGCAVAGYPNLLMMVGPRTVFGNIPPVVEIQGTFLRKLIRRAEEISAQTGRQCEIEATEHAVQDWTEICNQTAQKIAIGKGNSWMMGRNVPGKVVTSLMFLGGLNAFRGKIEDAQAKGFVGFQSPLGPAEGTARL